MATGAFCKNTVPSTVCHNCVNVVKPLNNPSVVFATNVAADPSPGTFKAYDSSLRSNAFTASLAMLFALAPRLNESLKLPTCLALLAPAKRDAPRSTTSGARSSFLKKLEVREMASWRSEGTRKEAEILKLFARRMVVFPASRLRGMGQRANVGVQMRRMERANAARRTMAFWNQR